MGKVVLQVKTEDVKYMGEKHHNKKLDPKLSKYLEFAVNHYPVKELMAPAKITCSADFGVANYNRKNHPQFYHNDKEFRRAIRHCISENAFDHRETYIRMLRLEDENPFEHKQREIIWKTRLPYPKEEWEKFYSVMIDKADSAITEHLQTKPLYLNDIFEVTNPAGVGRIYGEEENSPEVPVTFKQGNIKEYADIFHSEKADEYVLNIFLNANDLTFYEEVLGLFVMEADDELRAAGELLKESIPELIFDSTEYLSEKWKLGLSIDSIVKRVRKEFPRRKIAKFAANNPYFRSDMWLNL